MVSLYDLKSEYMDAVEAYMDAETVDETEAAYKLLTEIGENIADKAEAYAKIIITLNSELEATKAEKMRLEKRQHRLALAVGAMKTRLQDTMAETGIRRIDTTIGRWTIQKNPPSVDIRDADAVPERFRIHKPDDIDKKGILEWFKQSGEITDGVEIVQRDSIRFK